MKKNKILIAILISLVGIFLFSLFKNIAYSLLWNDEAETAMFATRILKYGYPKVHDEKNSVLYSLEFPGKLGIDKKTDAYLGSTWGQYYFSVIGVFFANKVKDLYLKTAIVRIPFAIIGFFGLFFMVLSVIKLFYKNKTKMFLFLNLFILFEILSISLSLHLRETRYYSLVVFLSGCVFYAYFNFKFFMNINANIYNILIVLLLLLLFNVFIPVFFIFLIVIGLYEFLDFLKEKKIKTFIINILPLIITSVLIIPFLIFFKTFDISRESAKYVNTHPHFEQIVTVLSFFIKYEYLYLVLFVKLFLIGLWFYLKKLKNLDFEQKTNDLLKIRISNFLSLFFIIYVIVIAKIPLSFIFERYFIVLQPVLIIILLLDSFTVFELLPQIKNFGLRISYIKMVLFVAIISIFILNSMNKIESVKGHVYELFHQYKGPLDFVIPYINSKYENTEKLIIATNYEEYSYMYYFDCKTIVGFLTNNLEEDLKLTPDIIIFRKIRADKITQVLFSTFFKKNRYEKVSFPFFDYPVNNIPELRDKFLPHLFKTKIAQNQVEYLDMYLKQ